jgi:predicted secreted protein
MSALKKLEESLVKIAGSNAIGVNDPDIANLCSCVNYLATQVKIVAEEGRCVDGIFEQAEDTINPKSDKKNTQG